MKIKQRNIGVLIFGILFTAFYIFAVIKLVLSDSNYFSSLSLIGYIGHIFYIALAVDIFMSVTYGSYIEIKNNLLIRSEGFLKKKFYFEKIKRIYCAHHIFLGPSMFLEYKKEESAPSGKEKKLLVLNLYRDVDKKTLLDFLGEKHPNIQQDENCEKIRKGEKVLTKW